jgi:allantoin racemase
LKIMVLMNEYTPDAFERRRRVVEASVSQGVEVGYGVIEGSRGGGVESGLHRTLVAPAAAREVVKAEKAGYDAVVAWGTLDLGVEEARHLVDIPVVGPGHVAASIATTLCQRFAVISTRSTSIRIHRRAIRSWGLERWAVDYRYIDIPPMELPDRVDEVRKRFVACGRAAVEEADAELILPLGYSIVPLTQDASELSAEIGVPVLDPLPLTLRIAEALAASGFRNSRAAYPSATLS